MPPDDDATRIRNLGELQDDFYAWNLNSDLLRTTWSIGQSEIGVNDGYPFGWIRYVLSGTDQAALVAVRWNQHEGQLQCTATDRSLRAGVLAEIERDARLRVGSLLTAYAHLGSKMALNPVAQKDLLTAAGLLAQSQ